MIPRKDVTTCKGTMKRPKYEIFGGLMALFPSVESTAPKTCPFCHGDTLEDFEKCFTEETEETNCITGSCLADYMYFEVEVFNFRHIVWLTYFILATKTLTALKATHAFSRQD